MEYIIKNRTPQALYNRFEEICSIPHGSGNESAIADHIEKYACERGLEVYRDRNNNVLVRRPASKGYEDHAPVLVQGHIDMVCEAEAWNKIDFTRDGLELRLSDDGKYLTANGTTLGADDGVAAAIMLALLDDSELSAPPLECLFTTEEETGLTGAHAFDYSVLKSHRMINLDTGGEVIIVSCAGGMRTSITADVPVSDCKGTSLTVCVDGLAGGHSGADIHLGRGNANLIALSLAEAASAVSEIRLISVSGGSKDNAIPSRCTVTFECGDPEAAKAAIEAKEKLIRADLTDADRDMTVTVTEGEYNGEAPEAGFEKRLFGFTGEVPTGVIAMCQGIDMVETSQNYAIIELTSGGKFRLCLSSRSSVSGVLDEIKDMLGSLAAKYGFKTETGSRYDGWEYAPTSPMRDAYVKAYADITGKDIPVTGIHAGLECGIIKRAVPDMDIIATGANTLGEHTTREALDLDSFERVYSAVKLLCRRL